jgi:hypothetical protein
MCGSSQCVSKAGGQLKQKFSRPGCLQNHQAIVANSRMSTIRVLPARSGIGSRLPAVQRSFFATCSINPTFINGLWMVSLFFSSASSWRWIGSRCSNVLTSISVKIGANSGSHSQETLRKRPVTAPCRQTESLPSRVSGFRSVPAHRLAAGPIPSSSRSPVLRLACKMRSSGSSRTLWAQVQWFDRLRFSGEPFSKPAASKGRIFAR